MQWSPSSDASNSSDGKKKSSLILWNPFVYCRVYKNAPIISAVDLNSPVHAFPTSLFNIYFIVILLPTYWYFMWSLFVAFPHQTSRLLRRQHVSRLSHSSRFVHVNNIDCYRMRSAN